MIECWREIAGISRGCRGSGVSVPPSCRVQVDAGQERGEFGGRHLDTAGRRVGNPIGSTLQSLRPNRQPVTIPPEYLDAISTLIDENEEMTRKRIEAKAPLNQGSQRVKALAHIGRFSGQVHADGGAQSEHGPASTTVIRRRRVWGSKPGPTAIRQPFGRISSRACGLAATRGVGSGRMVTGRKSGV